MSCCGKQTPCECPVAGFCQRHGIEKTAHWHKLCKTRIEFWNFYEQGIGPGQKKPNGQPVDMSCAHRGERLRIGECDLCGIKGQPFDVMSCAVHGECSHTRKHSKVKSCIACDERTAIEKPRQMESNPVGMPTLPPRVDLSNARRHIMFHLWPVAGNGIWQWHCEQLIKRAELWNGRRVVAIVESSESDSAGDVKKSLANFTDEFIVMRNDPNLREVLTWFPMMRRLREFDTERDVTFCGQGKCVRLNAGALDNSQEATARWTRAMYETCLSWRHVLPLLERYKCTGPFMKYMTPTDGGWGPWHYAGTFFWFRNRDVFARNWEEVPAQFFGTEAWPGRLFYRQEVACIACDDVGDLYDAGYWDSHIDPLLEKWRAT